MKDGTTVDTDGTHEKQALTGIPGTFRSIFMHSNEKKISRRLPPERLARMVETIYGCKWSLTVLGLIATGANRPGEMVRRVEGLTTKVLNQCLRKNLDFGIIERKAYPEIPPRVEYSITPFGAKFVRILDELERLQAEINELEVSGGNRFRAKRSRRA
jgi:DNA-binding HxlR family transcriptional regulator